MEEQGLFDQIVSRLGKQLKELLEIVAHGHLPPAAIEGHLQALLRGLGRDVLGALLEAADAALEPQASVHDRQTRTVVTLFGPVDITRRRLMDQRYPLDTSLGLCGRHGWTLAVQEAVSLLGCEKAFAGVCDLLWRLLGLKLSTPAVEQLAEAAGERAAELPPAPPAESAAGQTLVVAIDGCQAPQIDGWHEVKLATLYTNNHRVKVSPGRGRILQKEYLASLEEAAGFGTLLWQAAERWQVSRARRVVVMGDGAPWIWNLAGLHFPGAIEIVDFYHAAEHLWSTGEALWGDRGSSAATRSWVRHHRRSLRKGRVDLVIAAIERAQETRGPMRPPACRETIRRNLAYFKNNRERMAYARFKAMHLPIGTGAVEGACKHVVQSRFKLPGCRWSHRGLKNMLALKQLRLNQNWDQLWQPIAA